MGGSHDNCSYIVRMVQALSPKKKMEGGHDNCSYVVRTVQALSKKKKYKTPRSIHTAYKREQSRWHSVSKLNESLKTKVTKALK